MYYATGSGVQRHQNRAVFDARVLNLFCPCPEMAFPTLRLFQRGLERDSWLLALDHRSGYLNVPLHEDSCKYFGFQYRGQTFVYKTLSFGWAPSAFVYQTLSAPLGAVLATLGLHNIIYIDDVSVGLAAGCAPNVRAWAGWVLVSLMTASGYFVALPKLSLVPKRVIELLGFIVDTHAQLFAVPERKVSGLLQLLDEVIGGAAGSGGAHCSALQLQRLLGKAQSMSPPHARMQATRH